MEFKFILNVVKRKDTLKTDYGQFADTALRRRRFADTAVRRHGGTPTRRFADTAVRRHGGSPTRRFADKDEGMPDDWATRLIRRKTIERHSYIIISRVGIT